MAPAHRSPSRYVPSLVDDQVLHALHELHFLTVEQLTRLLYSPSSKNYAGEILTRLYRAGYLQRTYLCPPLFQGRAKAVYLLARSGMRYLEQLGHDADRRARPSEHRIHGAQFLQHTLAVTSVLIAAKRLERLSVGVTVTGLRHEQELKRSAGIHVSVREDNDGKVFVVPDAWVCFQITGVATTDRVRQVPLWFEVDRGTESVRALKAKVLGMLAYRTAGHYERVFGTTHGQMVFVVEEGAFASPERATRRVGQIKRWIEEVVQETGQRSRAHLFRVGLLPAQNTIEPAHLFLHALWEQPHSRSPIPLLVLPQRTAGSEQSGQRRPVLVT